MSDLSLNQQVIAEFRANGGRVGRHLEGCTAPKPTQVCIRTSGASAQDRHGLLARSGFDFSFYAKSAPQLSRPDLVGTAASFGIDPTGTGLTLASTPGMAMGVYQLRVGSRFS